MRRKLPSPYGFWVAELEPVDPDWANVPQGTRVAFWKYADAMAYRLYVGQVKAGKGADGNALAAISKLTAQARDDDVNPVTGNKPYSPMGRARGKRPPLTPCASKSRIVSLLKTKVFPGTGQAPGGVYFYWGRDSHTGKDWGEILDRHRRGFTQRFVYPTHSVGDVPSRDVFGLSPGNLRVLEIKMAAWWKLEKPKAMPPELAAGQGAPAIGVGLPLTKSQQGRPEARFRPGSVQPVATLGHELGANLELAVMHSGSRRQVEAAAAAGRFSGFRTNFGPAPKLFQIPRPGPPPGPAPGTLVLPMPKPPRPSSATPKSTMDAAQAAPGPGRGGSNARKQTAKYLKERGIRVQVEGHASIVAAKGEREARIIVASYDHANRTVYLNQRHRFWADPARSMRRSFLRGFSSTDNPKHVDYQEEAHATHHAAIGARYVALRADALTAEQREIAGRVSDYATASPVEFVAEVFAGLKSGKIYDEEVMELYRTFQGPTP